MTDTTVAEQIARLEALPDQEQAPESAGDLAFAVRVLQNHYCNVIERQELAEQVDDLDEHCQGLRELIKEQTAGLEALIEQRDHYKTSCDKMLKKHNDHVAEAGAELVKIDRLCRAQGEELKTLRALNPQRLAKQVKELQKKIKTQADANSKQTAEIKRLRLLQADTKRLAEANVRLTQDNRVLDMALSEAAKDINQGAKIVPLWEEGDWGIYPSETDGALVVVDKTTDIARSYSDAQKLIKARPVPAKIQAQCETVLAKLAQIRSGMTDYHQQGAA